MSDNKRYVKKIRITGELHFTTAFHIGSGREGELGSDMGVLLDPDDNPVLPGSTLKGNFRAFAERLSGHFGMDACLLDTSLSAVDCVGDAPYRRETYKKMRELERGGKLVTEKQKLDFIEAHTCHVCRLFGSPLQASRIFFSDGRLDEGGGHILKRDGVCLDRDTETARPKAKYDFEVVSAGAVFTTAIDLENPDDRELALVAAALGEWENGFRLGGFTSRGLGRVEFRNTSVASLNYENTEELLTYLVSKQMTDAPKLLEDALVQYLKG